MEICFNVSGTIGEEQVDETYSLVEHARETARLLDSGGVTVLRPHGMRANTLVIERELQHGTAAFDEFCKAVDLIDVFTSETINQ